MGLSSSAAVLLCYIMALADVNEIELTDLELIQTNYNTRTDECKVAAFNLLAYEGLPTIFAIS